MDFAELQTVYEWPRNGAAEPVRWAFRPMGHAEKVSYLTAQARFARSAEAEAPDVGLYYDASARTLAALTVRVDGLPSSWPAGGEAGAVSPAQLDYLARVSQERINEMIAHVNAHCAGLGGEARGK